jgi:hypothetical protein
MLKKLFYIKIIFLSDRYTCKFRWDDRSRGLAVILKLNRKLYGAPYIYIHMLAAFAGFFRATF